MAKIMLGNPSAIEMRGMEERIQKFKMYLDKAFNDKLKQNCEVCGFFVISPRGGANYSTITFNGQTVGTIGGGKFDVRPYNERAFLASNKYKYDVLCEIRNEMLNITDEDNEIEEIDAAKIEESTNEEVQESKPKASTKKGAKRKSSKSKG